MFATNRYLAAVEHQVEINPTKPAHRNSDGVITSYADLWTLSDRIAYGLLQHEANREPVVVVGHKSALMVVCFLACLKSGHAFVPVDVEMPASRLADIVSQLGDPLMLKTQVLSGATGTHLAGRRILDAQDLAGKAPLAPTLDSSSWACGEETQYIIFTSGSTGRPKGIEISVHNVECFMDWLDTFPFICEGGQVFLDQAPYSFDLSQYEVVGALSTGGCLYSVSREEVANMRMLFTNLRSSGIDVWVSTPSFADMCLADVSFDQKLLPSLRLFLFCGEALHHNTAALLRKRFDHAQIINSYGPTESTVAVTALEIGEDQLRDPSPLAVGMPRPGTELLIVDPQTNVVCETGNSGEIVIKGDTVAKGYYRNPEKTDLVFSQARLIDGRAVRAYKTGDMGWLDAKGMLHCEGRLDSLIKLNGFRVELEDVEENFEALPLVKRAVVVPVTRRGHIAYLKAFVTLSEPSDLPSFQVSRQLREGLSELVPPYMIPRIIEPVEELPLTANAKVDRKALAEA